MDRIQFVHAWALSRILAINQWLKKAWLSRAQLNSQLLDAMHVYIQGNRTVM